MFGGGLGLLFHTLGWLFLFFSGLDGCRDTHLLLRSLGGGKRSNILGLGLRGNLMDFLNMSLAAGSSWLRRGSDGSLGGLSFRFLFNCNWLFDNLSSLGWGVDVLKNSECIFMRFSSSRLRDLLLLLLNSLLCLDLLFSLPQGCLNRCLRFDFVE